MDGSQDRKVLDEEIGDPGTVTHSEKAPGHRPDGQRIGVSDEPADLGVNEAHLVRKLDMFLIPLVMALYLFSFLDR